MSVESVTMTLFGNRVFANVIKLRLKSSRIDQKQRVRPTDQEREKSEKEGKGKIAPLERSYKKGRIFEDIVSRGYL